MHLYNTLSRRVEELPPPPGPIRMYVCGSTVYKRVHVGNARPYVLGMWLKRWLERHGYDVTLVHNITDVDDHIYEEAQKQGVPSRELAGGATDWFFEDTDDLGLGRPDLEPKASETIPEIVALVEKLVALGYAYQANGDVYFRVARYPEYGQLSGAKLEEMVAQEPSDLKEDRRHASRRARPLGAGGAPALLPHRTLVEAGRLLRRDQVQQLAKEREQARAAKDFATSDTIRERIAELGWIVQDSPDGSVLIPK